MFGDAQVGDICIPKHLRVLCTSTVNSGMPGDAIRHRTCHDPYFRFPPSIVLQRFSLVGRSY